MKQVVLSKKCQLAVERGRILLNEKDLEPRDLDNEFVHFYNQQGKFWASGYLSKQNKGLGWVLSRESVTWADFGLQALVAAAKEKRQAYLQDTGTTAFRVFNQEGDGFPGLTVDLYGDYLLFSWYNAFVFQQKEDIIACFQAIYPECLGAYEKVRFRGPGYETAHLYGETAPEQFLIAENGVRYQVFLDDGWMTGIFLDQHEVRKDLAQGLAQGQRVLNLFSYTAAFSVAAVAGGAVETVSVDLAKRSRELSQAHFQANGMGLDSHALVVMDTFEYLRYAARKSLTFDVIIIDPPSFARNKKQVFSVSKDYHRLVEESLKILAPQGKMLLSTNAAQLSLDKFKQEIQKGMGETSYTIEKVYRLPQDFPSYAEEPTSNYLKVIQIRVDE
ncbi:class I SAM-dependent rRNA methyltransferase [Streptococcus danieliae]|uniref:Class I SAM-dependent rRNA methyltransferase n=1 Tax=Streptococcus danieliae TaxID=747656 RepID=A0A7Z0LD90_9STRE|nr:class I SAM-dependent rRNA methyltransferase [Streptococcus danieliae]MBF0717403.1 class I SAM-dependent rRNA methyltransferase [Streptococcus danieliae]NYS49333.1 class I SAM-dependent rRNA methyltransferase [Streptococcus danieliae]